MQVLNCPRLQITCSFQSTLPLLMKVITRRFLRRVSNSPQRASSERVQALGSSTHRK